MHGTVVVSNRVASNLADASKSSARGELVSIVSVLRVAALRTNEGFSVFRCIEEGAAPLALAAAYACALPGHVGITG